MSESTADWTHEHGHGISQVRVTRYALRRLQAATGAIPLAMGAGILARRFPEHVSPYLVFAFYGALLCVLLSAIKRFGRLTVHVSPSEILLGEDERISLADVSRWAFHEKLARLYGEEVTLALRARAQDADELRLQLSRVLGPPLLLQPRGSVRARRIALTIGILSLLTGLGGLALHSPLVAIFSIPLIIFSFASFAALRQRVLRLT